MPIVTATPIGQANGQVITEFIDSVGTSAVTYTFPKAQGTLFVKNTGTIPISVTVGGVNQTIQPWQKWEITVMFNSFDIVSTNGIQSFEVRADEDGSTLDPKYQVENKVVNGDFSNGITGWTGLFATIAASNDFGRKSLKMTTTLDGGGGAYQHLVIDKSDIYYFTCNVYNQSADSFMVRVTKDNTTTTLYANDTYTTKGSWQKVSFLITPNMVESITSGIRLYVRTGEAKTQVAYLDDVTLINLTTEFGEGKEPSKEDMDVGFERGNVSLSNVVKWLTKPGGKNFKYNFDVIDSRSINHVSTGTYLADTDVNTAVKLYALYDNLVTQYSDYITRTLLGTEATGLPIYRYDFNPPIVGGTGGLPLPKALYITGTHGSEYPSVANGIRFFTELCNSWKTSEILRVLRWNMGFTVVPCLNPWGHNNVNRKNSRGVDINRNFPNGWTANPDTTSIMYPGTAALSETETQLAYNLFTNEPFIFIIDHHNANTLSSSGKVMYTVSKDEYGSMRGFTNTIGSFMSSKFKQEFSNVDQTNTNLSEARNYTKTNAEGMMMGSFISPGMIYESLFGWGTVTGSTPELLQKYYSEVLAVMLYSAYRVYYVTAQ